MKDQEFVGERLEDVMKKVSNLRNHSSGIFVTCDEDDTRLNVKIDENEIITQSWWG
jgi:hypothetical protein